MYQVRIPLSHNKTRGYIKRRGSGRIVSRSLLCDKLLCKEGRGLVLTFKVFAAMELAVDVAQALIGDMRINLSGNNIFMAQKFLDAAQVNSLG